jgi:hypothetical protein
MSNLEEGPSAPILVWNSKTAALRKKLVRGVSQDAAPASVPAASRKDVISMGFSPSARLLVALENDPTNSVSNEKLISWRHALPPYVCVNTV